VAALVAAAVVAVLHMAFLVYMVVGGFLALHRFAWIWPSVGTTIYSIYVTLTDFTCPVTRLEKRLLVMGGKTPYEGSFTAHYLRGTLYPAQFETAIWLTAMGVAIASYVIVLTRRRRHWLERDRLPQT
jgi:asparagine N-glycosylation enzyme membrane subunit Stt3